MKLYFGNTVTTVTTLMIIALIVFTGYTFYARADICHWGRRSALLLVYGLAVCCFATARDGLDKTIQHAIDGSCAPADQRADRHRLHRSVDHHRCRHSYTFHKITAYERELVLPHVRRCIAQDPDDGDLQDPDVTSRMRSSGAGYYSSLLNVSHTSL